MILNKSLLPFSKDGFLVLDEFKKRLFLFGMMMVSATKQRRMKRPSITVFVIVLFWATNHRSFIPSATAAAAAWSSPLSGGPWGPTNPIADPAAMIFFAGPYNLTNNNHTVVRITVLTERLLRVERATSPSALEDRKTIAVIHRHLPVPKFRHSITNEGVGIVETDCVTLTYQVGREFSPETLQIRGKMYCSDASQQQQHYVPASNNKRTAKSKDKI